jgi:hypothetical protein
MKRCWTKGQNAGKSSEKLSDPRSELRWDLALTFRLLLQQRRRKRNGVQSMPL